MIQMGAKTAVNKHAVARFDEIIKTLSDEKLMADAMLEAAEPVADAARQNIQRLTGQTGDQITAWVPEGKRELGKVTVLVGIKGPDVVGKASRSFIGRFLEFGTSKMRAFPWLRLAADALGGAAFVSRLMAILRGKLGKAA